MRNPLRVVFSAPPEHGLYTVLDIWPYIREKVPSAELFVFSNFEAWEKSGGPSDTQPDEPTRYLIAQLKERLRTTEGVHQAIREQSEFAKVLQLSGVWIYLSTRDDKLRDTVVYKDLGLAMQAGCRVVTSIAGMLPEVVGRRGIAVPGDALRQLTRTGYVNALLHVLQAPEGPNKSPALDREEIARWARN